LFPLPRVPSGQGTGVGTVLPDFAAAGIVPVVGPPPVGLPMCVMASAAADAAALAARLAPRSQRRVYVGNLPPGMYQLFF
jgi:hypothetical protein